MTSLLHAADFHLDTPFAALSPEQAALRRREARELPDRLADLAAERNIPLVLLAGDLFDGSTVFYETAEALIRALGRMPSRVFIAPGNHDFFSPDSPYGSIRWPENVHIFRSPSVEAVELPELGCVVYGAGFTSARCAQSLLAGFSAPRREGITNLMVLHGDAGNPGSLYNPMSEAEIAASGLDYLALGHVHSFGGLRRAGGTFYAYPGCPEGRGFDETGEKGVLIGRAGPGQAEIRFQPMAKRRYQILTASLGPAADPLQAVLDILPAGSENDICRVLFTGESGPGGLPLEKLNTALAGRCFALTLKNGTRVRRDIWEQAGEDSLRGLFLRRMRARYDAAEEPEREQIALAVRFGLAALDNREELS